MNDRIKPIETFLHAKRMFPMDRIGIYIGEFDNQTKVARFAESVEMKDVDPGKMIPPTLDIHVNSAQSLMDQLWDAGIRPTEGTGSAGALAATQKHLDDMRKLVAKSCDITL